MTSSSQTENRKSAARKRVIASLLLGVDSSSATLTTTMATTNASKKQKVVAAGQRPKRRRSAYQFFSSARRKVLKEQDPSLGFGEISQLISAEWKAMSEVDRRRYVEQSEADADRAVKEQHQWLKKQREKEDEEKEEKKRNKKRKVVYERDYYDLGEAFCDDDGGGAGLEEREDRAEEIGSLADFIVDDDELEDVSFAASLDSSEPSFAPGSSGADDSSAFDPAAPSSSSSSSSSADDGDDDGDGDDRPVCQYGRDCYRKNPQHIADFFHPKSSK